jgi:hypothetical protein
MSDREPRLRLPSAFRIITGQPELEARGLHEEAAELARLTGALLEPAQALASPVARLVAQHELLPFRHALDALAGYLTCRWGSHAPGFEGEVLVPVNYPMRLQRAVMSLGETVQELQDWDGEQPADGPPGLLDPQLTAFLKERHAELLAALLPPPPAGLLAEERYILIVLESAGGQSLTGQEIARKSAEMNQQDRSRMPHRLSLTTINRLVPRLLKNGLVGRPPGTQRRGVLLMPAGREALVKTN